MNSSAGDPAPIRFERRYEDTEVRELWELWATAEGFTAWWGPDQFRVEVHAFDLCPGGKLAYDMIAATPQSIEAMQRMNMPVSHATHGRFVEVRPLEYLELAHQIDFIPGVKPYENRIRVTFTQEGRSAVMRIDVDPHHDAAFTVMAEKGMSSQLTKVPAVLRARR